MTAAGGTARIAVLFGATLGLSGADTATISATTDDIEHAFGVGNAEVGLLVSIVTLLGALFAIPVGVVADRFRRTRLLAASVACWAVALVLSGTAQSYWWMLAARSLLGVVTAAAGPLIASLVGDYVPGYRRGRVYGVILSGELIGTGCGFVVSGELAGLVSWRLAMLWLVPVGALLAWLIHRLPEPDRGGPRRPADRTGRDPMPGMLAERGIRPVERMVLHDDPAKRSLWWAIGYVLRVRTNVVIIVASALGYFFFAAIRSFAIVYAMRQYSLPKSVASLLVVVIGAGAVVGVLAGGRLTDRLLRRGHPRVRVAVPAVCLLILTPVLAAAVASTDALLAVPLLAIGTAVLAAANPPFDAARLDIMHPRLWGRAEAVRTALRSIAETSGPVGLGLVADALHTVPQGWTYSVLLFMAPLPVAGLIALLGLRTYLRDVATALASVRATSPGTAAR
jgi:predicted MFS family arabinose efflux permease